MRPGNGKQGREAAWSKHFLMSSLIEGEEQLERELTPEPIAAPMVGSLLFHGLLFGGILAWGLIGGLFHRNNWGSQQAGGAIEAKITSALPLPNDQPRNDNVLATETPSTAPAEPAARPQKAVEEEAIPVRGKEKKEKPQKPAAKTPQHQPPPKPDNKAHYGEQSGSNIARATQNQTVSNGPVSIYNADFGSRYGYYVDNIKRKMLANWIKQLVDPRTPKGTRAYISFTIRRDGTDTDVRMERSSGVPTLDRSCMQAAQRVDTFGPLPADFRESSLPVSFYCEY
jgi:protein TonB